MGDLNQIGAQRHRHEGAFGTHEGLLLHKLRDRALSAQSTSWNSPRPSVPSAVKLICLSQYFDKLYKIGQNRTLFGVSEAGRCSKSLMNETF